MGAKTFIAARVGVSKKAGVGNLRDRRTTEAAAVFSTTRPATAGPVGLVRA